VLARDGYRCVYCGRRDKLQAHHLDPISESDPSTWYDASRIVTACAHCHGPLDGSRSRNPSRNPSPQPSRTVEPPADDEGPMLA
jgi:5-methylcytosine-specific restriction endonuclease McrA